MSPSNATEIPNWSSARGVGGDELGGLAAVGPASEGLGEDVGGTVVAVVLVSSHQDGVAVDGDGDSELVARRSAEGGELGGLAAVGPAAGGLGEYVSRAFVVVVGIGVVLVRPYHDGVAVHRHRIPELVVRRAVIGGELGYLLPHAGDLDKDVGRTGIAGGVAVVVGVVVLIRSDHRGIAVHRHRISE